MIKVIYEVKNDQYISLSVKGHANSDEYGKDLICASVSSIMFGFMNALDMLDEDVKIKQLTNKITISNHSSSEMVQDYFELVMVQLKTIEESYRDFIKVERK
ncbi:MAG: ribosomal-processing cysteine protease Prp [Erysipelotrichaceae bacterium]|nr:ribosomal-processing cysteine protease Prp [Erysipelotrichaceae bacterium]